MMFFNLFTKNHQKRYCLFDKAVLLALLGFIVLLSFSKNLLWAHAPIVETVTACAIPREIPLTMSLRQHIATCLDWQVDEHLAHCEGFYRINNRLLPTDGAVHIESDRVSLLDSGRSTLRGHVNIEDATREVSAQTAYLYRDATSKQITKIELLGDVHYKEIDKLMIAERVIINPNDHAGSIWEAIYRLGNPANKATLPAWGRAKTIERFANKNMALTQATYSTCAPNDNAWQIEARQLTVNSATDTGVARDALIRLRGVPVLYSPYLTFPTSKKRKSGFLLPIYGYSNISGVDLALPYYWNIAPNYDATLIPHLYSRRGVMMGAKFRYLTAHSTGIIGAHILPHDRAFSQYITQNEAQYPQLTGESATRWSILFNDTTALTPDLTFDATVQTVSDDYFLQDFSSNLAVLTERQLPRQGSLTYQTDHWQWHGLVQSYQTLNPVNLSLISGVYERLPQIAGYGQYDELPFGTALSVMGEYDQFHWATTDQVMPEGPRFYFNPTLSRPWVKSWGYFTPSLALLGSQYTVSSLDVLPHQSFQRTWMQSVIDTGLYFERNTQWFDKALTQTLEPRLYYLNTPYRAQTASPVYDSAYMIFNTDQLFRRNRFSGFDRIGDANQLAYALTSRWLSQETGNEKLSLTLGQIRYFENRRVPLCYSPLGYSCVDSPTTLGYLSTTSDYSPVAFQAMYHLTTPLSIIGGFAWDGATNSSNNGQLILNYQPEPAKIINAGITYLTNGDTTLVAYNGVQTNALYQATAAFAWPINEKWQGLGAFNYNISKGYSMLSLLGVQYDSCCWAMRILGSRTFNNLGPNGQVGYNNNVYLQILLKGIGSVGNSDPTSTLHTFIPGYNDSFHR